MTYATDRPYCDADSHIMETKDWIANFTDPEILAKLPQMSLLKSGTKSFEVINEAVVKTKAACRERRGGGRRGEGSKGLECAGRV